MLELSNVSLPLDAGLCNQEARDLMRDVVAKVLHLSPADIQEVCFLKQSVDARKKSNVHFVATLGVCLTDPSRETEVNRAVLSGVNVKDHVDYKPLFIPQVKPCGRRPLVVGAGPAGLFCALYLARAGLRPVVLERGGDVDERLEAIAAFEAGLDLSLNSNIQFGEGGAGTFSDGKLTTNIKNPMACHVLRWFVDAGAPEEILWQAKPHIGTDLLVDIVRTLREQIIEAGGEVRFNTQLIDLHLEQGVLVGVDICEADKVEYLTADQVVLACGHSARDTFEAVYAAGIELEQKPFSVGVRIEHAQSDINAAQYGLAANHPALGAAEYKLAVHLPNGRGVYTFCMCPGGEVVCAASEAQGVVVNGMSRFAREGKNANSALLVGVGPEDFASDHPLAGIELQRSMEQAAFEAAQAAGGRPYAAPAQTVSDFLAHTEGFASKSVVPSYARGVVWCDLRKCLPDYVAESLEQALPLLDRKLKSFACGDAVMTGVETRSSSPVRIVRDDRCQARVQDGSEGSSSGLYPCGEGAGYAGGIMSAACDGLRVAQAVAEEAR